MSRRYGLLLCACATIVTAASTGCCCKKGFVVRGDWSLELNRVPFMAGHGPKYEPCCTDYGCDAPCSCTEGCTVESCTSACSCPAHAGLGSHGGYAAGGYGPHGGMGAGGYGPGAVDGYAEGGSAMPPPPQPTAAAQARFHPVPTRPVFEPTGEGYAVPQGGWTAAAGKSQPMR